VRGGTIRLRLVSGAEQGNTLALIVRPSRQIENAQKIKHFNI